EGRSLDVIDKGITWNTSNGISNNTYEFLKASKDMKSVTLVPIDSKNKKEYVKDYMMEPKVIGNFPIEFKPSEYGSLIIEDIKVSDKEIRYTYYKDGIVRYNPYLFFFDENGKEITHNSDGNVQESINRHTGRYTTVFKFKDGEFKSSNIKKVSFYTDKNIRLLYDKKVKIDL
ncbi:MAG: hypothetical protein RR645_02630, partial [Clostridium sp.]